MITMAAAGAGLVPMALRRPAGGPARDETWAWPEVARWTVRLPRGADLQGKMRGDMVVYAGSASDAELIAKLPAHPKMAWTAGGVRTTEEPRDVIHALREIIAEDLSAGRLRLAGGWVLAETEWVLVQLAAVGPRLTADAT